MRILADQHHADLLYSLQLLFEDRLGYELYIPKGHEWWDEGYWRFGFAIAGDDRLARQYLDVESTATGLNGIFDPAHPNRVIHTVELRAAKQMTWDAVLATVQENQPGFWRFAHEHGAKYLYHVGNTRQQIDWELSPLVLNAAEMPIQGRGIRIREEFDAERLFRYRPRAGNVKQVTSFINLLPLIPEAWEPFDGLRKLLPDYGFSSFGHNCPDGFLNPVDAVADTMTRSGWAYHDKVTGDGFGMVIHYWAAIGRPLIGHARYYRGQRAEPFWRHGETAIDLDRVSVEEAASMIRGMPWRRYQEMCHDIRSIFDELVDWEADAEQVRGLLAQ